MRIKKMAKKILATILILTMIVPYMSLIPQKVKAADQTGSKETVVESDGVKYVWYDDISPYRTKDSQEQYYSESPKDSGYVFGGWFQSANDTSSIKNETDGGAWAKFVPDEVFTVKAQISIAQPTTGVGFEDILSGVTKVNLRLVTGVDSFQYNKVVFRITHLGKTLEYPFQDVLKEIDVKADETKDFETVEPKAVFGDAAIRFATIRIMGISNARERYLKDWKVTPLIVTQDGTMVSGVTREQLYIADALSNVTDGEGFEPDNDGVTYTHTNKTATAIPSHQYLKGGSDTVYLSGTYTTDGTGVNTFGLAVRSAGVERYIVFDGHGFKVMTEEGADVYTQNIYTTASGEVQVWVDSAKTDNPVISEINTLLTTSFSTEGNVVWAISDNVLYCNVAEKGAFKVPMTKLCDTWVSGRNYQVGIVGYNTVGAESSMTYKQTKFLLGEKASDKLIAPTSKITSFKNMGYDPISGAYISEYSTAGTGAATSPASADTAVGIHADMDWSANDGSGAGITIVLDGNNDKSIQYLLLTENSARLHGSYAWYSTYIPEPNNTVMTDIHGTKKNGVVSIKAAVYDDKLSVLVNDTTTYQVELSELFGEAYTGEQKISIGLGTYSAYEGTPRFTNVKVYEGQDAIDMKMEHWTFLTSSASGTVSYDVTTGDVSIAEYGGLQLQGNSDVWEISGTLSHDAISDNHSLHGFGISSGTNGVRIFERTTGFQYDNQTTAGWSEAVATCEDNENVFKTEDTTKMLVNDAVSPMTFKAMVVENVFYFWLNDRLTWRIPVQTMNSAIAADSKYNMAFYSWASQAKYGDIVVRTGSEVDADFLETMNIAKEALWQNAKNTWEMKADGTIARYDVNQSLTDWQSIAFNRFSTDIYMTGTWKKTTDTVSDFGIFIEDSDGNKRSVLFNGKGFVVGSNEEGKVEHTLVDNGYVYALDKDDNSQIEKMLTGSTKEHDVIYAITNNTLYVKVDDCIAGIIPMSVLCSTWTDDANTEFGVGLTYNAQQDIESASFANAQVKYGSDALSCLVAETEVASNMSSTDGTKFIYNPIAGAYIAKYIDSSAVLYGNASATTVGIQTDIQWHDMAGSDGAVGISVKSATTGKSVEWMLRADNKTLRKLENATWDQYEDIALSNVTPFNSQELCRLSAVVQNGTLKLMCNGDLADTFDLSEYLDGYSNENVFLGIATNNSDEGIAYFTDIKYYTGDAATALLPDEMQGEDTSVPECGLSKLENASSTIDESGLNIYRAATRDGVSVATIDGANKEWSISGTMKQPDLGRLLPQGFVITSGEKSLKLLGAENGFISVVNDGEWNSDNSTIGSSATYNSYFAGTERTSTSIDFALKIGNDKLYLHTTNLVWMIDLTSETYGGFAAGSDYTISFVMEDYALEGTFENMKIQRGSDIEKVFEVDESVGTYETTTAVISETLGTISKNSEVGETIYFDGISQTWEIRGTMTQENLMQRIRQGFVVRDPQSGTECIFTAEDRGFLKVDAVGWEWFSVQEDNPKYILDESQTRTFAQVEEESGSRQSKTIDFRIVVKDDVMFVFMNDVLSWRIPLTYANMGGFTAGSDYQLGVTWLSNEESEGASIADTGFIISSVKTRDEADTSGIIKYVVSSSSSEMVSDGVKGEISVNPTDNDVKTVYFASDETNNSSTRWEISGTLTAKNIMKGFTVKSADGTKSMYVTLNDSSWNGIGLNEKWTSGSEWNIYTVDGEYVFDAVNDSGITWNNTNIDFRVLIVDDVFYGWINNKLAWKLPLSYETFGGFATGTSYCLGLRNIDQGSATWSNLSVKYGSQIQTEQDIYIRDPFVLADNDTYYMYGTTKPYKGSFDVFTSKNLISWERQERCFVADENFWGKDSFWAPEVYKYTYNGETAYYMFASFEGSDALNGTSVLKADSPLGPFKAWSNGALTMPGHDCIDGTLYVDETGNPYMIYSHVWECDDKNCYNPGVLPTMGSIAYVELSPDLKSIATDAEYQEWFDGKYGDMNNFVTDGPFVYTNNGQKYLLWSTTDQTPNPSSYKTMCTPFNELGETIDIEQQTTILYGEDGGHAMVFTDFAGDDCLVLHTPNKGDTRAKFFTITNVENELKIEPKADEFFTLVLSGSKHYDTTDIENGTVIYTGSGEQVLELNAAVGSNDDVYVEAVLKKGEEFNMSDLRLGFRLGSMNLDVVSSNQNELKLQMTDWNDEFPEYNFTETQKAAFEGEGLRIGAARIGGKFYMYIENENVMESVLEKEYPNYANSAFNIKLVTWDGASGAVYSGLQWKIGENVAP